MEQTTQSSPSSSTGPEGTSMILSTENVVVSSLANSPMTASKGGIDDSPAPDSDRKPPSKKRASTGGVKVKASSISSKVPAFLSKSTKGNVTYFTMIHEAIVVLGDRTGSSVPAIQKFIKDRHPEVNCVKPKQFNTAVYSAIKAGLKEEKLIKMKCSYKVNRKWVEKEKSAFRAKETKKKLMEKKKKKQVEEAKKKKQVEEAKKKKEAAEKAAKEAKLKQQKLEAERKKKAEKEKAHSEEEKMKMKIAVSLSLWFSIMMCGMISDLTNIFSIGA